MRLVSKRVLKQYDQHIPYLTLRLSNSSTEQQLQQWCQAVERLQHVAKVRVKIIREVSADMFDLSMQLLSQQVRDITELHLVGDDYSSGGNSSNSGCRYAVLPSLHPLQHLLSRLHTLVISSIAVTDLASDLSQLATAAAAAVGSSFPLQSLTLHVTWSYPCVPHWSKVGPALQRLTRLFPEVHHLSIKVPGLQYHAVAAEAATQYLEQPSRTGLGVKGSACRDCGCHSSRGRCTTAATARNAHVLTVIEVPAMWSTVTETLTKTAAEDVTVLDAALEGGSLPSVSAAAAAHPTLDDYGCWLLQQHQGMTDLHVQTTDPEWGMSWQRQRQQQQADPVYESHTDISSTAGSSPTCKAAATAAVMRDVTINCAPEAHRLFVTNTVPSLVRAGRHGNNSWCSNPVSAEHWTNAALSQLRCSWTASPAAS